MTDELQATLIELQEIAAKYPEKVRAAIDAQPELKKQLNQYFALYSASLKVTFEGFKTFYEEIYDRELPYVVEPIVHEFVRAFHEKTGVMEECWRGFGKSTVLIAWAAYIVGARPVGSTAVVRINDTKAKEAGDAIGEIIMTNSGWKKIFPHVVPDKEAGWSVERGYHVKDTRVADYNEWLQMCFADHVSEPSLACGGVESGIIIGMHPSNGMWFDDLHDELNTRSAAEMTKMLDVLEGNIIETWSGVGGSPALGVACTPWSEKDSYERMMRTGMFTKVSIPLFVREVPEIHPAKWIWERNLEKYGRERFEPYSCDVILTWPEKFPMDVVMQRYQKNPARFGQMSLLDLSTLKGLTLKRERLGEYPAEKIGEYWPTYFSIDFASTTDKLRNRDTDYFALAVGKKLPQGGTVCIGGFRDRLSMQDGITKIQALSVIYKPLAIGVEKYGSGKQFIEQLIAQTSLPIIPLPIEGTAQKSKGIRFETQLDGDFANGRMWISDVKDDFLMAFIDEWISWDGGLQKSRTGHDDTLDAMYWLREITNAAWEGRAPGAERNTRKRTLSPFATAGAAYRR